jgi:hypothetical protein
LETLAVRRKDGKEEYTVVTEWPNVRMMDPKTDHKKPMTDHQLLRHFRSLAKKREADCVIEHKNGVVERWDDEGYNRYDPRAEQRQLQKWIKEHADDNGLKIPVKAK